MKCLHQLQKNELMHMSGTFDSRNEKSVSALKAALVSAGEKRRTTEHGICTGQRGYRAARFGGRTPCARHAGPAVEVDCGVGASRTLRWDYSQMRASMADGTRPTEASPIPICSFFHSRSPPFRQAILSRKSTLHRGITRDTIFFENPSHRNVPYINAAVH